MTSSPGCAEEWQVVSREEELWEYLDWWAGGTMGSTEDYMGTKPCVTAYLVRSAVVESPSCLTMRVL